MNSGWWGRNGFVAGNIEIWVAGYEFHIKIWNSYKNGLEKRFYVLFLRKKEFSSRLAVKSKNLLNWTSRVLIEFHSKSKNFTSLLVYGKYRNSVWYHYSHRYYAYY